MKNYKFIVFIFIILSNVLYAKKMRIRSSANLSNNLPLERFKDKHWLNEHSWFKINSLCEILQKNLSITYKKIVDKINFDCPEFSISPKFPHKGYFHELFILSIPSGRVQGERGYVFINGQLPDEMARGDRFECLTNIPKIKKENVKRISGRVAVIAQHGADKQFANYYHWLYEVLGRLAMLEIAGIEYDFLYVGHSKKFMKETLELWGIDFSKIIEPTDDNFCIEADELIVPSLVINTSVGHKHAGNFQHPVTSMYIRKKLFTAAQAQNIDTSKFSKRVFISRKDAYSARKILNWDNEIFKFFEQKGFGSYELSNLSVASQIMLFYNAEVIVSEQGSGLANILFSNSETKIIEIFQALIDNCFWWISSFCRLNYFPVKALEQDTDYFADWRDNDFSQLYQSCGSQVIVSLDLIKKIIDTL